MMTLKSKLTADNKRELRLISAGCVSTALITFAIIKSLHPSLVYAYRDAIDALGLLKYFHKMAPTLGVPFLNLQMLGGFYFINYGLSPSAWPILIFGTEQINLDVSYVVCAIELYLTTYVLARTLGSTIIAALMSALLLPLFILELVWPQGPFDLLRIGTIFGDILVLNNLILIGLSRIFAPNGGSTRNYILIAFAAGWLVCLTPLQAALVIPFDVGVYIVLSSRLLGTELFWSRQLRFAILIAFLLLFFGPYLLGLLLDTSSAVFRPELVGDTFTVFRPYLAIPFRNRTDFVLSAIIIAGLFIVYWLAPQRSQDRTFISKLIGIGIALAVTEGVFAFNFIVIERGSATFPRPFYFEIAAWPIYFLFVGLLCDMASRRLQSWAPLGSSYLVIGVCLGLAAIMATVLPKHYDSSLMPYRPTDDAITRYLIAQLDPAGTEFTGQVATIAGPTGIDKMLAYDRSVGVSVGNSHRGEALRYFGIRTLDEYNNLITPTKFLFLTRLFSRQSDPQNRVMISFTQVNQTGLAAVGVRYVVTDRPLPPPATLATQQKIPGIGMHFVYALQDVNLGTYSPIELRVAPKLDDQLRAILESGFDFRHTGVTAEALPPLRPAQSRLSAGPGWYRITAASPGKSLLVLPIAYTPCLRWVNDDSRAPAPRLLRADFALTGLLFDRSVAGTIRPTNGPLSDPFCAIADWLETRGLGGVHDRLWPAAPLHQARAEQFR